MKNSFPTLLALCLALLMLPPVCRAQVLAFTSPLQDGAASTPVAVRALHEVLREFKNRYRVDILFADQMVAGYTVPADAVDPAGKLEKNLETVLTPFGLQFKKARDGSYLITRRKASPAAAPQPERGASGAMTPAGGHAYAAAVPVDRTVQGTVAADDAPAGLPGVAVLLKGTSTGTTTDAAGRYQLAVPDDNAVLVFSFVGYVTEEVAVGSRTTVDVSLVADIKSLGEVVVVGYGTQNRKDLTGAIASVKGADLSRIPVASAEQALQGQAAGVEIVTNNGAPGSNVAVRIRGVGTVNSTDPLYVVDGFPVFGGIGSINPNDIESIEVLKDASAGAIYGARAANGVVIVTTKKGKEGPLKITFDTYYGSQSAWRKLPLLDAQQYRDLLTETAVNAGKTPPPAVTDASNRNNTDWQDLMFRSAPIQHYSLGLSSGGKFGSFHVSGSYFKQDGILINTNFQRITLQVASEGHKGRFRFGESVLLTGDASRPEPTYIGGSMFNNLLSSSPLVAPLNAANDGGYGGPTQTYDANDIINPYGYTNLVENKQRGLRVLGSLFGEFEVLDNLRYRLNLGTDIGTNFGTLFTPTYNMGTASKPLAELYRNGGYGASWLVENTLTYKKSFGSHALTALAGYSEQFLYNDGINASARNFPGNGVRVLDAGTADRTAGGSIGELALRSYFVRANYAYADKYLLTATVRRDGSSRFSQDRRYGTFPSVSVGWVVSEEAFLKNVAAVSFLKLRASYGLLGNQDIGNYQYATTLNLSSNYVFGNEVANGVVQRQFANPDAKWETTRQTDVGLDLGLWQDRVLFTADYYAKQTEDMLIQVPIPLSTGSVGSLPFVNAGGVANKGWEFGLTYKRAEGDWRYSVTGNLSTYRNEVTSLGASGSPIFAAGLTKTEVGSSIGRFYGFVTDGLYQTEAEINPQFAPNAKPGDIRFRDLDNDNKLTDKDRAFIGSPLPRFSYGLSGNAGYRNFDVSLLFFGVAGNDIANFTTIPNMNRNFNTTTVALDRWTPGNRDTNVPRAVLGDPNNNTQFSDRYIEKGSFLRLRNVTVGYTLPATVLERLRLGSLRVYVSGQNLLTVTNYTGYDPEVGGGSGRSQYTGPAGGTQNLGRGVDTGIYPLPRTLLGGVQIGF